MGISFQICLLIKYNFNMFLYVCFRGKNHGIEIEVFRVRYLLEPLSYALCRYASKKNGPMS